MLKRVILSSSLVAASLALTPAHNAFANWGTYQYDAQHGGKAPVKGPSVANVKWSYQAGQQVFTNPNDPNNDWFSVSSFRAGVTEGPDGTIYTAGDDGRAYAFDPRNGAVKYIFDGVGVCCASPVVGKDGTIYFSGNGLFALNPDFTLKFYYPDGGNCCGAITVADDGTVIVGNGWLHAFDPANLVFVDPTNPDPIMAKVVAPKWIYNAMSADWSAAVSKDGKTIYAQGWGDPLHNLVAIDPNNLTLGEDGKYYAATKWSLPIMNDRDTMPVIDPVTGTIYIADDQKIIAVDPNTVAVRTVVTFPGKQVTRIALNGGTLITTLMPVIIDPITGARSFDDQNDGAIEMKAVNPVAGSVVWTVPLVGAGSSTNPIIDSTGAIYIGTVSNADGMEYRADLKMINSNGTQVFTITKYTTMESDQRCMIIGMDGTLYTIMDGSLIVYGGTADLAPIILANPNPATTNGPLSFTTTVTNNGPDKAVNAILRQTLPGGFTNQPEFVLPGNCAMNNGSRVLTCTLGEIAPGTNVPVTFTSKAQAIVGSESTSAAVKSDVPDPNTGNSSAVITVPVNAPVTCDLSVTAVGGPTSITRGSTKYNYTATVKNIGTGTCAASTLGFYFSSDTTITTTSPDVQIGTSSINSLSAGASQSVTLNVAVSTSKIAAGSYYIGAYADSPKTIAETNESNNTLAKTTKTTVN